MHNLPKQKLPRSQKDAKWQKECIDAGIHTATDTSYSRRSPRATKLRNYGMYNGEFDPADLEYVTSPYNLKEHNLSFPASMQMYAIHVPIFDLLFGEETKRPYNYTVKTVNDSAISVKQSAYQESIKEKLFMLITEKGTEEEIQAKYSSLVEDSKYSFKAAEEVNAKRLLGYFERRLNLDQIYRKGWEDALLGAEEIYHIDIVNNSPKVRACNPIEIDAVLPHNSDILDESPLIVENTWMSLNELLDNFGEDLTATQLSKLEERFASGSASAAVPGDSVLLPPRNDVENRFSQTSSGNYGRPWFDESSGQISVRYVTWKSFKKVFVRSYMDEYGSIEEDLVSEEYQKQPNDIKLTTTWINEYWFGVKIGDDLYLEAKPKYSQFRDMDNIYTCKSGYVGTVYNCNNAQAVSLMDRLVPWIYMYMILFYNTELLISSNYGSIALIDASLVPDGWDVDQWLYYAKSMKIGWIDTFAEKNKGERQGKQNQSQQNKQLNMDIGNSIQQYISLLEYIEGKVKEISGVTDQRMGAISASERVGNTQRSVVQSSHITEKWFNLHNWTKQRVMTTLLEVAKDWVGEETKRLEYVGSDLSSVLFTLDGNKYGAYDYGVFITNAAKDMEELDKLEQLMHAAMQNDAISLAQAADIITNNTTAEVKQSLRDAERKKEERGAAAQKAEQEAMKAEMQMKAEELKVKKSEIDKDYYKIDADNKTKVHIAELNLESRDLGGSNDEDSDGIEDDVEIKKHLDTMDLKDRELAERTRSNMKNEELKARQIAKASQKSNLSS